MLWSAAGPGVNTLLQDAQRQSCTISSFFRRVPLRVSTWLPQCGHASGTFDVWGTRATRGSGRARGDLGCERPRSIRQKLHYYICRLPHRTHIERTVHGNRAMKGSRMLVVRRRALRAVVPSFADWCGRAGRGRWRAGCCDRCCAASFGEVAPGATRQAWLVRVMTCGLL